MAKHIKLTENQFKTIVESMTKGEMGETHKESEPFSDYANDEQEDLAHGESHKEKNYKNPHLNEEEGEEDEDEDIDYLKDLMDTISIDEELDIMEMDDSAVIELNDYIDNKRGPVKKFYAAIPFSALVPETGDEETDRKIAGAMVRYMIKDILSEAEVSPTHDFETFLDSYIQFS
jgi:hypothetical protein